MISRHRPGRGDYKYLPSNNFFFLSQKQQHHTQQNNNTTKTTITTITKQQHEHFETITYVFFTPFVIVPGDFFRYNTTLNNSFTIPHSKHLLYNTPLQTPPLQYPTPNTSFTIPHSKHLLYNTPL